MSYSFHRLAADDLSQAARFYRLEGGRALAARFVDEFERVMALLEEYPEIGTPVDPLRRSFPFSTFPYAVIYRPLPKEVRVLVIRHQSRDPVYGELRI
jgi:toxin ParE1/3/4